ncbi:hypothetical protein RS030_172645 [Cryptosporidium xiaoi]|uniref:Uncharacterized protein n=1 Tax=Cryptosporidium xiaoi TaxID=659607 RepID=A0AAV9XZT6_9CRYT
MPRNWSLFHFVNMKDKFWCLFIYLLCFFTYTGLMCLAIYEERKANWYYMGFASALTFTACIFVYWRWISISIFCSNLAYSQKKTN